MSVSQLEISLCESVSWQKKSLGINLCGAQTQKRAKRDFALTSSSCNNSFSLRTPVLSGLQTQPTRSYYTIVAA